MTILKSSGSTYVAQLSTAFGGLVVAVLLARLLGPEGRGVAAIAVLLPAVFAALVNPGFASVFMRSDPVDGPTVSWVPFVHLSIWLATAVASVPFAGAALALARVGAGDALLFLSAWPLVPLSLYNSAVTYLAIRMDQVATRSLAVVLQSAASTLTAAALLSAGAGPISVVVAVAIGLGVSTALLSARVLADLDIWRWRMSTRTFIGMLQYGIRGNVGQLAQFLNYRLDSLLLAVIAGPQAVGIYATATSVAESTGYISSAVAVAAYPRLAADGEALVDVLTRWSVVLTLVSAVLLALASPLLIPALFGSAFSGAILPMDLLLPGVVALAPARLLSVAITARGHPGLASAPFVAAVGVTIVLDVLLIPELGAFGAALASSCAYAVAAAIIVLTYRALTAASVRGLLVLNRRDILAVSDLIHGSWRQ